MKDNEFFRNFDEEYSQKLNISLNQLEKIVSDDSYFIQETGINPKFNKNKGTNAEYGNYDSKLKLYIKNNNFYR
jgi:hypothetical protein